MTDSYGESQQGGGQAGGGRDGARRRSGGNREGGGFRIRLSDNEMRSVRALQEAFNLRSTVAVLGFAVRSLGQMLEDGQLDALIEQQRSQAPRGGDRRRNDGDRSGGRRDGGGRGQRPDPFARPAKPQPAPAEVAEEPAVSAEEPDVSNAQTTASEPAAEDQDNTASADATTTEA